MAERKKVKWFTEIDGNISVGLKSLKFLKVTKIRESSIEAASLAEGFPVTQYY